MLLDPFLLATRILGLDLGTEESKQNNDTINDAQEKAENVSPLSGEEQPIDSTEELQPDFNDDHSSAMDEPVDQVQRSIDEPPASTPTTPVYGRTNGRSNRTPHYNARYNEYRRSLGIGTEELNLLGEFRAKHASAFFIETDEPQSYKQALASPFSEKWMQAFQEEYDSLTENGTWKLVQPPPGCSIINCKWIGRIKPASDGVPERFKGRLVAIGSRQKYGIDYDEIFSPVPHQEAVKAALAEIASLNLELMQLDVKTAFLHAPLDKTMYMKQPEGFVSPGKEDHVCLLLKSLYGLKQAPRLWFGILDKALGSFGLKNSSADKCIYVLRTSSTTTIAIVHVDDFIIGASSKDTLNALAAHLRNLFQVRTVPPTRFLGINITRDQTNRKMFLSQEHMVEKLLERFGMEQIHPKVIPADPNKHLQANTSAKSEREKQASRYPYREAVGALLYLALSTRPDISYAVGQVAKYCQNPDESHWEAVSQIFG